MIPLRRHNRFRTLEVVYATATILLCLGFQQWHQGHLWAAAVLWVVAASVLYVLEQTAQEPPNSAYDFVRRGGAKEKHKPILICLGDSITQGKCSSNWVSKLSNLMQEKQPLEILNNAQNSITTYTVLQERVDWTLACDPDFCVLLIGSNDAHALVNPGWNRIEQSCWGLTGPITEATVEANFRGIVDKLLHSKPDLKVAICTIPPLGEDLTAVWNREGADKVNSIIRKVVGEATKKFHDRLTLLDVHGALTSKIRRADQSSGSSMSMLLYHMAWQGYGRHVFGLEWNTMSSWLGNAVLIDAIHLNDTGGSILSSLVADWLVQQQQKQ